VVHTAVAWSSPAEFGRWKIPSLIDITPGSPPAQIDSAVWEDSDIYLFKHYPSAFFGTDLSSVLQRSGVDTVLVMGATSSGCVRATIVDSFSHGFRTLAVEDACGDQSVESHEANMRDVGRRYADVIDSATAMTELRARAARPVAS
jgi:maleamate amidohydrolase